MWMSEFIYLFVQILMQTFPILGGQILYSNFADGPQLH